VAVIFPSQPQNALYVSRSDCSDPLAAWSAYPFELDGAEWPTVEHYYQGMKFEQETLREQIRRADTPAQAQAVAKRQNRQIRADWKVMRVTVMLRGLYIRCRTYSALAERLLASADRPIVETSQYDYFWGCGRDFRGENAFGKALMLVRERLIQEREEQLTGGAIND
jgi:ribA/ribD-fused uncharacterized protein